MGEIITIEIDQTTKPILRVRVTPLHVGDGDFEGYLDHILELQKDALCIVYCLIESYERLENFPLYEEDEVTHFHSKSELVDWDRVHLMLSGVIPEQEGVRQAALLEKQLNEGSSLVWG